MRNGAEPDISMIAVSMIWGMTFVAMKVLLGDISPGNLVLFRFLIAGLLFLPVIIILKLRFPLKDFCYLCLLSFFGVTLYQLIWTSALSYGSIINVSIILYAAPIFTIFFNAVSGRTNMTFQRALSIGMGMVGLFIVMTHLGQTDQYHNTRAELYALGGSAMWSLYTLLSRPLLLRHSPLKIAMYSVVAGSMFLCFFAPSLVRVNQFAALSIAGWLTLIFITVVSITAALPLWYKNAIMAGPVRAFAYQHMVPVFAALFAVLLDKERVYPFQLLGGFMIGGGMALEMRDFVRRGYERPA